MSLLDWGDVVVAILAAGCAGVFAIVVRNIWSDRPRQLAPTGRTGLAADGAAGWGAGSVICSNGDGGACDGGGGDG